ncbi:MAG: hypothetical protein JXQ89_18915 [Pelagimonas sp.]
MTRALALILMGGALWGAPLQAERLMPLAETYPAPSTSEQLDRCRGFVGALDIIRTILTNNPASGFDASQGVALEWVIPLSKRVSLTSLDAQTWLSRYMDAFSPLDIPTLIPNTPLYQSDKASCLRLLSQD